MSGRWEELEEEWLPIYDDDGDAARGCLLAMLGGLALWTVIILVVLWL